jgi:hypothetical protein
MGRYIHKQCESTGWLNHHECPDPSMLGVMIKLGHNQHSIHPSTLHPMTILAINFIDAAIAFTMASEVTSTFFRQMSPYQSEILVQPQGIRIPVFESLEDVMQLDSNSLIRDYSCIVRRERIVLVWSNTVDNVLPHGSEVEKLLLETVSHDLQTIFKDRRLTLSDMGSILKSAHQSNPSFSQSECFLQDTNSSQFVSTNNQCDGQREKRSQLLRR